MDPLKRAILGLHFAVFLFGFTGVLGKLILLPALVLVWWRSLLSWILMTPYVLKQGGLKNVPLKSRLIYTGIGFIVGLHWICFYGSIKLANSSVAMVCLALIPVFTAFFEAFFEKKPVNRLDVIVGLITIPAMWMIVQNIDFNYRIGLVVGIFAALFSACFAALNKKYIGSAKAMQISWMEMFSVWLLMSLLMPLVFKLEPGAHFIPSGMDWIYLILLSYLCTVIAYVLALKALKHISAFSAMLIFNMEPVYGIFLAIILLNEHKEMNILFYTGVLIILISVFIHPFLQWYHQKSKFS